MITPNDIETKVFSSSLRGYNKREVDEFLDQIMIDYQAMLDQNEKMLERVHVLQKQVAEAKDPAKMTQDAKRLMNDISASAEQKAEVIIKNAKHDAENIVRNARNSTSQADEDAERLRRKVEKFKLRFRQMLEEEIDRVDDNSEDLLDDLRQDFYPGLLYGEAGDMTKVAGTPAEAEDPIAELPDVEPTGGLEPEEPDEESEEELEEPEPEEEDQNPDAEEEGEAVSDETLIIESEEPEEPEDAADEAEELEGSEELEGADEEAEESDELEGADEEPEDMSGETIIIDREALAKAQAEIDGGFSAHVEEAADLPDARSEVLQKDPGEAEFEEYEDPDRLTEEEEEPAPETEEEQAAKYAADYAGDEGVTDDTIVIGSKGSIIGDLFHKKED